MDVATSLVQAYLRLNGYLTAVEYPLIESGHHEPAQVVTDIDLLAVRFGCCAPGEGHEVVRQLLRRGRADTSSGHAVRMVLFASGGERAPRGWHWIRLDHVVSVMDAFLRRRNDIYRGVDVQDPALAWLALLQKCGFTLCRKEGE